MCTVGELIEYLQKLPADCEVAVVVENRRHYDTYTEWVSLELGEDSETVYLFPEKRGLQLGGR